MKKQILAELLEKLVFNAVANLHTITIAKITAVNANTIDCQPVTARVVNGKAVELPVFSQVPPIWLQGGTSHLTMPVKVGDYCVLLFTERCYERWWNGVDNVAPVEVRMHDYSDGLALVGVNPLASLLAIPSVIELFGDAQFDGNHVHNGTMDRTGDTTITGNLTVNGDIIVPAGGYLEVELFKTGGGLSGVSGTFTTVDGKTVTVTNGIITSIV